MSYSTKFREEVMKFIDEGNSIKRTSAQFSIGETTIKEWKKLRNKTGSLEKRPLNRTFKKIDPEKLIAYLEEYPDAYQHEIAKAFGCVQNAVFEALKRLGITRKKNSCIPREG
jgi:transposase